MLLFFRPLLHTRNMPKSRNIPIRFSEDMIAAMERGAAQLQLQNRSDLIKVAVKSLLRYLDEHGPGGMRVEFTNIVRDLDGRTHRYEIKPSAFAKVAESSPEYGEKKKPKK